MALKRARPKGIKVPGLKIWLPTDVSEATRRKATEIGKRQIAARRKAALERLTERSKAKALGRREAWKTAMEGRSHVRTLEQQVASFIGDREFFTVNVKGNMYKLWPSKGKRVAVQRIEGGSLQSVIDLAERTAVIKAAAKHLKK